MILRGCDKAKYKSLVKGFVNQFSLKNDQYPKTMQDMSDALSKHTFDEEFHKRNKRKAEQRKKKPKEDKGDDDEDNNELNFAQALKRKQYACYKCGKSDHPLSKCPLNIPKKDWWINRMIQGMQDGDEDESEDDEGEGEEPRNPVSYTHLTLPTICSV